MQKAVQVWYIIHFSFSWREIFYENHLHILSSSKFMVLLLTCAIKAGRYCIQECILGRQKPLPGWHWVSSFWPPIVACKNGRVSLALGSKRYCDAIKFITQILFTTWQYNFQDKMIRMRKIENPGECYRKFHELLASTWNP